MTMTEKPTETHRLAIKNVDVPLAQPSLMPSGQSIWSEVLDHCEINLGDAFEDERLGYRLP